MNLLVLFLLFFTALILTVIKGARPLIKLLRFVVYDPNVVVQERSESSSPLARRESWLDVFLEERSGCILGFFVSYLFFAVFVVVPFFIFEAIVYQIGNFWISLLALFGLIWAWIVWIYLPSLLRYQYNLDRIDDGSDINNPSFRSVYNVRRPVMIYLQLTSWGLIIYLWYLFITIVYKLVM